MPEKTYYKMLQVDPAAEPDVIAAAHRVLVTKLDPDRDATGVAEYRVRELNRALAVLTDAGQRRAYNEHLAASLASDQVPMGPGHNGHSLGERLNTLGTDGAVNIRLDFGRYSGRTLGELARSDPDYLRWLSRHSSGIRYRGAIMRILAEREEHRTPLRVSP
jgi:DnaJ-class molecular chaperone